MNRMRSVRLAVLAAAAVLLSSCAGLPTDGAVNAGLDVGAVGGGSDVIFLPDGPSPGASPAEIVAGFLEAGTSPAGGWAIAQQFLSEDLAQTWRPDASVTVDRGSVPRVFDSVEDESARSAAVEVTLTPVASVDPAGTYRESTGGTAEAPYELARNDEGEWRISSAPDGIVLDEESFAQVFRRYTLHFFDPGWEHLVPDPRWFPRRPTIATTIAQAVIDGAPSEWLAASVQSAFPADVTLAVTSVPVVEQSANVALSASAVDLDAMTLGRMRTQLERSLAGAGVTEVRFFVDGRDLAAEPVDIVSNRIDPATLVLTAEAFGPIVGDEVTDIPGVSETILGLSEPVTSIDLAGDGQSAVVGMASGTAAVRGGRITELDPRPGLVAPSLDTNDYAWSVPAGFPQDLVAWSPDGDFHEIVGAWPGATRISHLRVSPDGVRVAAVVTAGGQEWVTLSGIIRDGNAVPVELGPVEQLRRLPGAARGLAWLGEDTLGVLTRDGDTPQLLEVVIGGPDSASVVPADVVGLAGANTVAGARLLSDAGAVLIKRGTTWQESFSGIRVLGTQSGK